MPQKRNDANPTLALSTKVEEDFVAPLTAVRGSLEILRDFDELTDKERQRFVETALRSCAKLERAVDELAATVYAAGQKTSFAGRAGASADRFRHYSGRVEILEDLDIIEIDFSEFEFSNSATVNAFYDVIDDVVGSTGRAWYFLVNYNNCSVWPEAWVAFAHRGKKISVNHSLGTVRYSESEQSDSGLASSRDGGLDQIAAMKTANTEQS